MSKDFWIVIILLLAMLGSGFAGWSFRGERIQTKIVKIQVKQQGQVEEVKEKKAAREIVYRDRIKVIHESTDNCLAQPLPPDILRALSAGAAEPRTGEGLRLSAVGGPYLPRRD